MAWEKLTCMKLHVATRYEPKSSCMSQQELDGLSLILVSWAPYIHSHASLTQNFHSKTAIDLFLCLAETCKNMQMNIGVFICWDYCAFYSGPNDISRWRNEYNVCPVLYNQGRLIILSCLHEWRRNEVGNHRKAAETPASQAGGKKTQSITYVQSKVTEMPQFLSHKQLSKP